MSRSLIQSDQRRQSQGDAASNHGATGTTHARYRPEIDGLRALAVIAVIANHFNKDVTPSGYLGVDIFFVISGYVVTASLFNHRHESIRDFLLGFYSRRVRRLIPALVACITLTSLAICFFNPSPGVSLRTGLAALFGISNIYLFSQSTDYFAAATELNAFTQTWSLGVEEQFYMVYPLIMWLTGASPSGWRVRRVMITILALSLFSLVAYLLLQSSSASAAYFLMPLRFWELGAGVLVFALSRSRIIERLARNELFSILVLIAIAATLFAPKTDIASATLLIVFLSMLAIAFIAPSSIAYRLLTLRPIVAVGLMSYSLYLWHWSVLAIGRWTTGIHPWTAPFQLVAMLALGLASYHWIEMPCRRSSWGKSNGFTLLIGLGITSIAAIFLTSLGLSSSFTLYAGNRSLAKRNGQPKLTTPYQTNGVEGPGWKGQNCVLSDNGDVGKLINEQDCTIGSLKTARKRILVLGNSFAASFTTAFDQLIRSNGTAVTIVASWGASAVPEVENRSPWRLANNYYWNQIAPDQIQKLKGGDTVLLMSDLSDYSPEVRQQNDEDKLKKLRQGLETMGESLRSRNIQLAIIHGNPFAREANCLPDVARTEWFNSFGGPCRFLSRTETLRRRQPLDTMLKGLQKSSGLIVIDLMDVFCPGTSCTYEASDGTLLYRDSNSHPSVEASRLSAEVIERALHSAVSAPATGHP